MNRFAVCMTPVNTGADGKPANFFMASIPASVSFTAYGVHIIILMYCVRLAFV